MCLFYSFAPTYAANGILMDIPRVPQYAISPFDIRSFSAGVAVIRKCAALILPAVLPQNKKFILRNMRLLCWNGGFNRRFAGYIHLSIHFITK